MEGKSTRERERGRGRREGNLLAFVPEYVMRGILTSLVQYITRFIVCQEETKGKVPCTIKLYTIYIVAQSHFVCVH